MNFSSLSTSHEQQVPVNCCNVSSSHRQKHLSNCCNISHSSRGSRAWSLWSCQALALPDVEEASDSFPQNHACYQTLAMPSQELLTPKCLTAVVFTKIKTRRQTFWRDSLSYSIVKRISKDSQIYSLEFTLHFCFADSLCFSCEAVAFNDAVKLG